MRAPRATISIRLHTGPGSVSVAVNIYLDKLFIRQGWGDVIMEIGSLGSTNRHHGMVSPRKHW